MRNLVGFVFDIGNHRVHLILRLTMYGLRWFRLASRLLDSLRACACVQHDGWNRNGDDFAILMHGAPLPFVVRAS